MTSTYFVELTRNWRVLLSATLGVSAGLGIGAFAQSILAAYVVEEFSWAKADFALAGTVGLASLIFFPLAGRVIDLIGVRWVILPAVLVYPFTWAAYSLMDGSIRVYVILSLLQLCIGTLTSSIIYSRVVAEAFANARGIALAIMMSGPPLAGAIGSPLLVRFVEEFGWRSGYQAVALFCLTLGILAYLILPKTPSHSREPSSNKAFGLLADYRYIFSQKKFWLLFLGFSLCNIPNILHTTQMSLMLLDRGASALEVGSIISIMGIGIILGRFAGGFALDKFPPVRVAVVSMGLPAVGMILLALGHHGFALAAFSMMLVGLSQGAEGDLGAYLTIRYFDLRIYGSVYGLVISNAVMSTAIGTAILSMTLRQGDSYSMFLLIGAGAIVAGITLLAFLGAVREQTEELITT